MCAKSFSVLTVVALLPMSRSDLNAHGGLSSLDGAIRAASSGGSIVGVCCDNNMVVVATGSSIGERSLRAYPTQRTWLVDEGISISVVGLMSDARMVADFAFDECRGYRLAFGTSLSPLRLACSIADALASAARQSRPLGVHVVLAGIPSVLCHIDPTGRLRRMRALAAGKDTDVLTKQLANRMEQDEFVGDGAEFLRRVWHDAMSKACSDAEGVTSLDDDLEVTVLRGGKPK